VGSNFIVAKVVTFNGGKGGQGQEAKTFKRPKKPLNKFFCCFFAYFIFKKSLITSKFQL